MEKKIIKKKKLIQQKSSGTEQNEVFFILFYSPKLLSVTATELVENHNFSFLSF